MNQPPSTPGNKSNEVMNTLEESEKGKEPPLPTKKTKHNVVTRSPYNLRNQSQQDLNTCSLRTSSELEGICKSRNDPECSRIT